MTTMDARFFNSTRGQIVRLMRGTARTVEELAASLGLTDNAVRAHLATLERDGLVTLHGIRRGARKPHFTYLLTRAADDLFPKPYDALLNELLTILKGRLTPAELKAVLRELGRRIAKLKMKEGSDGYDLTARSRKAVELLEALGGAPRLETTGGKITIQSTSCPLAAAVESHPEVCSVAEALISEVTGGQVRECCSKTEIPPRCSFVIAKKGRLGR